MDEHHIWKSKMLPARAIVEVALLGAAFALAWNSVRSQSKASKSKQSANKNVPKKPLPGHTQRTHSDLTDAQLVSESFSLAHRTSDGNDDDILIIGVCGGSGSGKTTLSKAIIDDIGDSAVSYLSHDFYYKDLSHLSLEQRAEHNFDHPDALDTALMVSHLAKLKQGIACDIPMYDFTTHSRCLSTQHMSPKSVILVEGILLFTDPDLVDLMDIKVFVETPSDVRFIRRLKRDIRERGRTAESVIEQYMTTVRPMHLLFVEPSKRVADILVPVGVNAVALDLILSRLKSFMNKSA
ncbi:hypothetical protein DYB30_009093 [Aphanomyces astaci]|uniref:Uridine kinase n=1 Tax=Aphanomyces astaci TaxID=112090 RepID=A0A397BXT9_APHAT|nr:hypothetical protein DYB38_007824 [Aphanomyces astaci]RHY49667.1 hypothetical protein DYB34_009308 [Aphanomyces astaci]RHY67612.1 hypothetical protein DYB30_009093 [Aphanomyces astaci]RHZ02542.1 hypothetical protein DYB31_015796 [Aphanomyces astaci]RHZ36451.1 hypothetical protein DYB26_015877 [Aphanomyces astaci]